MYAVGIPIVMRNAFDERSKRAIDIESRAEATFGICFRPGPTAETRLNTFCRGYPTHIFETGPGYILDVLLFSEIGNTKTLVCNDSAITKSVRDTLLSGAKAQGVDAK